MIIKPTTIAIEEDPTNGWIQVRVSVQQLSGSSVCGATIKEYPIGRKVEAVAGKILEILKDYKNDGTLEG